MAPEWERLFSVVKNVDEAVDKLVESRCTALDMMVSEFKAQGESNYDISGTDITLCWKSLGGGNYEVYLLWGCSKSFFSTEEFKDYWQISDKVFKEEWSIVDEWINEYGYY